MNYLKEFDNDKLVVWLYTEDDRDEFCEIMSMIGYTIGIMDKSPTYAVISNASSGLVTTFNSGVSSDVLSNYAVISLEKFKHQLRDDDIEIFRTPSVIDKIKIPTVEKDGVDLLLKSNIGFDRLCELWEDRGSEHRGCDRIGIFKEDIPLLIKALEKVYDEYMDAKN